jgi:hypothetical protein
MASKFSPNKLQVIEIFEKIKKLTKADFLPGLPAWASNFLAACRIIRVLNSTLGLELVPLLPGLDNGQPFSLRPRDFEAVIGAKTKKNLSFREIRATLPVLEKFGFHNRTKRSPKRFFCGIGKPAA